jgi:H+/Cl- antiporter ClcA
MFAGLLGGFVGGGFVVAAMSSLKQMQEFFGRQATWMLLATPLVGLALTTLILHGVGRSPGSPSESGSKRPSKWRTFPEGTVRADITGDIVKTAGHEESFPWRLAPIRLLAIFATVGLGAGMGTEAPAAYLGVAADTCLGDRGRSWRKLLRPLALAGGAAGVAALMGIPLVGTAYVLEIGKRNGAPFDLDRVIAALLGGLVGWWINVTFELDLIRLVVPKEPPGSLTQAAITVFAIGGLSGAITSLAAAAVDRAKKWDDHPLLRLALGGVAVTAAAVVLMLIAEPRAAFGPGGGAILWAESHDALPRTLLAVALLRAATTTAAAAAGGCGGVFVPFLAIGDIAGRVFAPGLAVGNDLAGAAGAAAGIAGGYGLPLTAVAMVLGVGGPRAATLTCLGVVLVAYLVDRVNPLRAH